MPLASKLQYDTINFAIISALYNEITIGSHDSKLVGPV